MDALETIYTRRSIRHYTNETVPDDLLETVLRAAMAAPSAQNQQPWQFIVIRERATLDVIPQFHPHAQMLKEAGLAVVVCGDLRLETSEGRWQQDCCAAVENMLLAAHAVGLGAVWVGVYPREEHVVKIRSLLHLPDVIVPLAIIPLGFPAEKKKPGDRFDRRRIHANRWQG